MLDDGIQVPLAADRPVLQGERDAHDDGWGKNVTTKLTTLLGPTSLTIIPTFIKPE